MDRFRVMVRIMDMVKFRVMVMVKVMVMDMERVRGMVNFMERAMKTAIVYTGASSPRSGSWSWSLEWSRAWFRSKSWSESR